MESAMKSAMISEKKPGALVLTGFGINCDYESAAACTGAGFETERIHLNDLLRDGKRLFRNRLVVLPGGFSFGDDLGSGVAFSAKIRYAEAALFDLLCEFVTKGGLLLGICNGFQILVRLGLLPATEKSYGKQEATLAPNSEGYFVDRWVRLSVDESSGCVFTNGIRTLEMPVRHGEGRFLPGSEQVLRRLKRQTQICVRYCDPDGVPTQKFPYNPNDSTAAAAGVCDPSGRVFGLMPHPEAATLFHHHPDWTKRKRLYAKEHDVPPVHGDGHLIFANAFEYAK
jgi:phosphoribosylformylglycinamidine synthase I